MLFARVRRDRPPDPSPPLLFPPAYVCKESGVNGFRTAKAGTGRWEVSVWRPGIHGDIVSCVDDKSSRKQLD